MQTGQCGGIATFLLADRRFTCHGEVAAVKACGGPPRSGGIHFYLSLYASSNDSGTNSLLFPEVVKTEWGFAGFTGWKPVIRKSTGGASTSANSNNVCYSPGDFLGVTVYHQDTNGYICSLNHIYKMFILMLNVYKYNHFADAHCLYM